MDFQALTFVYYFFKNTIIKYSLTKFNPFYRNITTKYLLHIIISHKKAKVKVV